MVPEPCHPAANPEVLLREEADGEAWLVMPETGARVRLNAVGAAVFRLLDGTRDLAAIAARLEGDFTAVPPAVAEEVAAFVDELLRRGLATTEPPAARPAPPRPLPAAAGPLPAGLMPTPRSIHIDVTAQCNLRCRYCSYFASPVVPAADLPTAEWLRFFAELEAAAVLDVCLAGGEPFVRADLPALLDGIVRHRLRFSVLSNGGLVDDALAARLAATGRCDLVQISVDGATAATHDAARGRGAFEGALRGLRTLQRHGVPVTARVTIHRHNVPELTAIAALLLDDLGLTSISTNAAGEAGGCLPSAQDLLLGPDARRLAMETLGALEARYPGRLSAAAGPHAEAVAWRAMEDARRAAAPPPPGGGRLTGCGCPFTELTVRADGIMVPCSLLPHLALGRINRDPLPSVWRTAPALARLRARRSIPLEQFACCRGCAHVPYCTGNCPAAAYAQTGDVDHPSPDACLRRYLEAGGALPA